MPKNHAPTIERMIAYCKGQALVAPRGVRGSAYNNGVAACVRILEDMLPPPAPKRRSKR